MKFPMTPVRLGLLTTIFALQACNSSSDSDPVMSAQAVDGYLFGSAVTCDDMENGVTGLAGALDCPAGTGMMSVSRGADVGFDVTASTGVEFLGTLSAPGGMDYVTPLSTLVVALSTDEDGNFDPDVFAQETVALAQALGQSVIDLNSDPATTLQIVKLNAQVHQVLSAFAENPVAYQSAVDAFAKVVRDTASMTGSSLSFTTGVAGLLDQINTKLKAEPTTAGLALSGEELDERVVSVGEINADIDRAASPAEVTPVAAKAANELAGLTLVRDLLFIELDTAGAATRASLTGFESSALSNGSYGTVLSTALTGLAYTRNVMKVNRDLNDARASIGFRMKATTAGDARSLTYFTDDVYFSATQGDSGSLQVKLNEDAKLYVTSVSKGGATRNTTITLGNDYAFRNDDGNISVDNARVRKELADRGIDDVLDSNGNYEVTFAIGGLRVNSELEGVSRANDAQTLVANGKSMTGTGIKGYVTVVDAN